jgi:hypothetical protein
MVRVSLSKRQDPISKISKEKGASNVAEVVEHLPSNWEALSSNSSTTKKTLLVGVLGNVVAGALAPVVQRGYDAKLPPDRKLSILCSVVLKKV